MKLLAKWYSSMLSALLTALGFGSCGVNQGDQPPPTIYGVPNVDFTVKGVVTDQNGNPIAGIQVQSLHDGNVLATDTTDASGSYELPRQSDMALDYGKVLMATDTNPDRKGGAFDTARVEFRELPRKQVVKAANIFDEGAFELTGNLKMKKK